MDKGGWLCYPRPRHRWLTIHFIQDEFIGGDIQLPKLQGLLESRSTPLKTGRLVNVGYRKTGNKIQFLILKVRRGCFLRGATVSGSKILTHSNLLFWANSRKYVKKKSGNSLEVFKWEKLGLAGLAFEFRTAVLLPRMLYHRTLGVPDAKIVSLHAVYLCVGCTLTHTHSAKS